MTALATIDAHDMQPLVDDAEAERRWTEGFAKMVLPEPNIGEMIGAVDYLADEIEQSSKAALRCGGKLLPSRLRRVACLRRISRELEASQGRGRG